MIKSDILVDKSFDLAIEIVVLYKKITSEQKEFVLTKQILRSDTSIGANVTKAVAAISKADFRSKISIAHKEACETEYWLKLMFKSNYIDEKTFNSIFDQTREVNNILSKILISLNSQLK